MGNRRDVSSNAYGVVVIGRNEGSRLRRCLSSLPEKVHVVYVDSGSNDDSVMWARNQSIEVVELDQLEPFTAGRARNAGFLRLNELVPNLKYVQFIDGDCELDKDWPHNALSFLENNGEASAAFGRRRERYPNHSFYNKLCDLEWDVPIGEARACGGDVMMRVTTFQKVGGFRRDFIAGEEPELCVRMRAAGWKIFRLDHEMTLHDAAMSRFGQWWRRQVRSGYAFAQGAYLHGNSADRHWIWESRRALIWGFFLPLASTLSFSFFGPSGGALLLIYPLQILRRLPNKSGSFSLRLKLCFFELLSRFPECSGQFQFFRDRIACRAPRIIEYK